MKKLIVTYFSVIIALSLSGVVLAASNVNICNHKITKQMILSEEKPAPTPAPDPAPIPGPMPY